MAWIYKPKRDYKKQQNRTKRQDVYNTTLWRRLRLAKLREQPICQICEMEGKTKLSEHCHHLDSFMDAGNPVERDAKAFDSNNLICLCQYHHNQIHNGVLKGCKTLDEIKKRLELLNQ